MGHRKFGFIFKYRQNPDEYIHTIAHELGHGAFRLKHPYPAIDARMKTEDDLMAYNTSTRLTKKSWDECHDRDLGLNWGEGEEEGESVVEKDLIPLFWTEFLDSHIDATVTLLTPSGLPITIKDAKLTDCVVAAKSGSYIRVNGISIEIDEDKEQKESVKLFDTKPGAVYGFKLLTRNNSVETWLANFNKEGLFLGFFNVEKNSYYTDDKDYSESYTIFYWKGMANKEYQWESRIYCLNPSICKKIENYQATGPYQNDPFCLIENSCSPTPPAVEELKAIPWAKLIETDNEAFYYMGYIYYRYKLNSGYAFMACKYDEASNKNYFFIHDGSCWQPYSRPVFSDAPFTNLWYMCKSSGHTMLDIVGSAPLVGFLADGANGLWYMAEGDKINATICFVCAALPSIADASIKGAKYSIKIFKGLKGVPQAYDLSAEAYQSLNTLQKILRVADKPLFDEIMESLTKLYKEFPSQAADIERLAIAISNPQKLKAVLAKIEELGELKSSFMADIKVSTNFDAGSLANNLGKLDERLVDGWKSLGEFPTLRKSIPNLETLNKVKGKFTYNGKVGQEALEEMFTGHRSAQNFIDNLKKYDEIIGNLDDITVTGIKSSSEVRILNKGSQVGKIVDGKLNVNYSGFGGDIVCDSKRTTTLIGKWAGGTEDLWKSGIARQLDDAIGSPGGINILGNVDMSPSPSAIWQGQNKPWLDAAIKRGDVIRAVSDPIEIKHVFYDSKFIPNDVFSSPEKLATYLKSLSDAAPEVKQLSFYGREIRHLYQNGYTYNSSLKVFAK